MQYSFSYYTHKYSWLLKPRYFAMGSEGLSHALKSLLFEDKYRGAKDRAELQGYISEPHVRSMVDTLMTVESILDNL